MKNFKRALSVLLLVAVALTFISCGSDKSSDDKSSREYVGGISYDKPSGFTKQEMSGVVTWVPSDDYASDNIVVNTGKDSISLYSDNYLTELFNKTFSDYGMKVKNLKCSKGKRDEYDVATTTYDVYLDGDKVLSARQYSLFINGKSIHFTYTYESNKYDNIFQNLIDSIRVE